MHTDVPDQSWYRSLPIRAVYGPRPHPTRGSGQEAFKTSRVDSGRIGSARRRRFSNSHGTGPVTLTRPDPAWPARFDPTREQPSL